MSFENDVKYAIRCDHDYATWESSETESENEQEERELLTHKYVRDRDEAPFACSLIKEEEGDMEEKLEVKHEERDVAPAEQHEMALEQACTSKASEFEVNR